MFIIGVIYRTPRTYSDITLDEWMSVIKMSSLYGFEDARSLCIEELSKVNISPVHKLSLGQQYNVQAWVKEGYEALIAKEEIMTPEELLANANIVGWATMAKILQLRESGVSLTMQSISKRLNPDCEHRNDRVTVWASHCNKCHEIRTSAGQSQIERESRWDSGG
jgi:hypothetical protein